MVIKIMIFPLKMKRRKTLLITFPCLITLRVSETIRIYRRITLRRKTANQSSSYLSINLITLGWEDNLDQAKKFQTSQKSITRSEIRLTPKYSSRTLK